MRLQGQLLLVDADDTLWENNVYFERAIARYMEMFEPGHDRVEIRQCINAEERSTIAEMGYGLKSFAEALTRAFHALTPHALDADARRRIQELAASIAAEGIEMLPGVEETLRYLTPRHRLAMVTKGDYAEQTRKIKVSGLETLFESTHVVPEKNEAMYRAKLAELAADPGATWMIGNSPKSDINPALAAGLNAVFIPHPDTWVLEHEPLAKIWPDPGRLLQIDTFADLRHYF